MKYINTLTAFVNKQTAKGRTCTFATAKGTCYVVVVCPRKAEADKAKAAEGYATHSIAGYVETYILKHGFVYANDNKRKHIKFSI